MRTYISASNEFNTIDKHVNAPYIKKVFDLNKGKNAEIEISAVGFYRLWINGKEITKGFFAPYISNPDQVIYYDVYDVKELLKEKDNVIVVLLGNGFGNELDNNLWDFEKAEFRAAPKVYLSLRVDGQEVLTTDQSFMAVDSAITFDALRAGERYDARLEIEDIHLPVYNDGYKNVIIADTPKGIYKLCCAEPVTVQEKIKPINIIESKNGGLYDFDYDITKPEIEIIETEDGFVYDFGVIDVGLCKLNINAKAGQVIDMTFGEYCANERIDIRNCGFKFATKSSYKGYVQRAIYTCKDGEQEYIPSFTYFGFRYCLVKGITKEQATKDLLTFYTIHSNVKKRAEFACSDEVANKIQECAVRSGLGNLVYCITDCPTREKNGWTSEGHVSSEFILYNNDCVETLKEWYFNIQCAQREDGAIPGIVPTGGWGFNWGSGPQWDAILVELPLYIYKFTDDTEFLRSCAGSVINYIHYVMTRVKDNGLIEFGLPDWAVLGGVGDDKYPGNNVEVTDTLKTIDNLNKAKAILNVVEIHSEDDFIDKSISVLVKNFADKYIDGYKVITGLQTPQALAIHLGLFDDKKEQAIEHLVELIKDTDCHLNSGVMGYRFVLNILADNGYVDFAYKLITQKTWPSWGNLIKQGATTLWETFTEFVHTERGIEQKMDSNRLWSLNHSCFGGVSTWFYNYVAGIKVKSAKVLEISPNFITGLESASASFENLGNTISVSWKMSNGKNVVCIENKGFDGIVKLGDFICKLVNGKKEYEI